MTTSITISATALRAVMPCAASSDVRYYLNGVALFPAKSGGVLAVGTDGNTIAFCLDRKGTWDDFDESPLIVARHGKKWEDGALRTVAALKKNCASAGTVTFSRDHANELKERGKASHLIHQGTIPVTVDGPIFHNARFPDVSAYVNPSVNDHPASINPDFFNLARECIVNGLNIENNLKSCGIVIHQNGESPAWITREIPSDFEWAMVVMPRRLTQNDAHPSAERRRYVETPNPTRAVRGLDWIASAFR
jgi:hypothetical protein